MLEEGKENALVLNRKKRESHPGLRNDPSQVLRAGKDTRKEIKERGAVHSGNCSTLGPRGQSVRRQSRPTLSRGVWIVRQLTKKKTKCC